MIDFMQILQSSFLSDERDAFSQLERRIVKATQMTYNAYSLWGQLMTDSAIGVIQSQTNENKFYYTFIRADGSYGCFDNDLQPCLGQPLYVPSQPNRRHNISNINNHNINNNYRYNGNYRNMVYHSNWKGDWNSILPCKHVFSLINGFCSQGDSKIESLLENWITRSLNEFQRPFRDKDYGDFIKARFNPVKDQVFQREVFKPLVNQSSSHYSLYKRSKNVKILDSTNEEKEPSVLELHVKITGEKIEALPLKNIICVSCLKREQNTSELDHWVKCIHCMNHLCKTCFQALTQENKKIPCPSIFNGSKPHNLDTISFYESLEEKKKNETKMISNVAEKDVIFKFSYD